MQTPKETHATDKPNQQKTSRDLRTNNHAIKQFCYSSGDTSSLLDTPIR